MCVKIQDVQKAYILKNISGQISVVHVVMGDEKIEETHNRLQNRKLSFFQSPDSFYMGWKTNTKIINRKNVWQFNIHL